MAGERNAFGRTRLNGSWNRTGVLSMGILMLLFVAAIPAQSSTVLFFSGNLRTNANVTSCGFACTLGPSNTDADYAQYAAVVNSFTVSTTTTMEAITYSYGGGTSLTGAVVPAGGLEPYLSLFDGSGNFLESTFLGSLMGTNCPPGANLVAGNCFDVELDGGTLTPGTYYIALSAWENMSYAENLGTGTLSDGFTGLGNLGNGEDLNYAFDVILPNNVTTAPEPSSLALLAMGCAGLIAQIRNRRHTR